MAISVTECLLKKLSLPPAKHYLVGFSGGRDSHVLLDLLFHLRKQGRLSTPLTAIYVNHNLNPKALDWAKHCQEVCKHYAIPFIVETIIDKPQTGESIEAFARKARYRLIEKHITKDTVFLSAHHQRDQAETFLLQLMRGSGLDGLRAMPVCRAFGQGQYCRPLLNVIYNEIVTYAKTNQLHHIHDDSNDDRRFNRNFIRHEVLPLLQKRFPQVEQSIAQSAAWLSEVNDDIENPTLVIEKLKQLPLTEQKKHIRQAIKNKTQISLTKQQTQYILQHHLHASTDKNPCIAVGDYCIRRFRDELIVSAQLPNVSGQILSQMLLQTIIIGDNYSFANIATLSWQQGEGLEQSTGKVLTLAPLNGKSRFHPHWRGHSTTVKKLLHEAGIAAWLRPFIPGIYLNKQLVAIPSIGVDKACYIKSSNAFIPLWHIAAKFVKI